MSRQLLVVLLPVFLFVPPAQSFAQGTPAPTLQLMQPQGPAAAPVVITLQDALEKAQKLDVGYQSALYDAQVASEDRLQAKAARLPLVTNRTQYLGTQGNGTLPSGRYVTNDGVHVYREWGIVTQDVTANTILATGYKRAQAAEAFARAKAEVAQRGLAVTVTRNYYGLVTTQRKYATAQLAVQQAARFLQITQDQERAGQAAHSDVVKADLQYQQQKQALDDATLAMENARLNLAVLLFSALNENFSVVDDLQSPPALPPFVDVRTMAEKENPDLRAADQAVQQANYDVSAARHAFLPAGSIETDYGIEANAFALHSSQAADPEHRVLPNLGYFVTATLNIPVWDWGTLKSRLRQTEFKQKEAQVVLTQTQRQLQANLYLFYNEALAARSAVDANRRAADLAAESLRLTTLRYQAGESSVLEVVDAQTSLIQARNAYDDAEARYRLAIVNLQTLTGGF
jgi:outer membrane protein TolC